MKLGIVYNTTTGNTEALANRAKETAEAKGIDVYFAKPSDVDREDLFSSDVFAFGSPAQGSEELEEEIQEFMDSIDGEIKGKKVFMFGSYGWGEGAYMDDWKAMIDAKGGIIVHEPVVCLESPDDDAFALIDEAIGAF